MSSDLDKARELLKRFERLEGDSSGLACLSQAIGLLGGIISRNETEGLEVARNVLCSYRTKVHKKASGLLDEAQTFKPELLEFWVNVMKVFSGAGLEVDESFNAAKISLIRAWLVQSLSSGELELLKRELVKGNNRGLACSFPIAF